MNDLGVVPGGDFSEATAINGRGQIVGRVNATTGTHVFIWEKGAMTDLGALPSGLGGSWGSAINDRAFIAGSSLVPVDKYHPILLSPREKDRHSLRLDGSNGYAEVASALDLNLTADWTVEAWFKDETAGGYNHDTSYVLAKGDSNVNGEDPYFVGVQWNTLFAGERTNWSSSYVQSSLAAVSMSTWHHAAATFVASTRQLTLYLDGTQVGQGILAARSASGNTLPVDIGRNGSTGQSWNGKLDDVRIWNVVRTATEISTNYRTELATAPASLVGNWKFNEGSGTTAADSTASPQNAVLLGPATWSPDVHP
jgi:probable HAF family extracellular repeat protein